MTEESNFRDAVSGYKDIADPTLAQLQHVLTLAGGPADIQHLLLALGITDADSRYSAVAARAGELGRQS